MNPTPEEQVAALKGTLQLRWDSEGQRIAGDLVRLLNCAETGGYSVNGMITDDGTEQVYSVEWYNGAGWHECCIRRGEQEWEVKRFS